MWVISIDQEGKTPDWCFRDVDILQSPYSKMDSKVYIDRADDTKEALLLQAYYAQGGFDKDILLLQ